MVAMALFLAGIMIFFVYSINQPTQARENLELLSYDGKIIADNLLSEGYPTNWDSSNVITLGITTDNKINQTKLEKLYDMIYTENNYTKTKNIFNTEYDYYIFLDQNMTIDTISVEGIGKPGTTLANISATDLIKTTRYTIYQNKTTPFYLYLWKE
ncbi:hypothetical protein HNV12_02825 [Methanococcoides sp. SA1]|nr:hypothetical protein [Methanococcoides sp. SA1]